MYAVWLDPAKANFYSAMQAVIWCHECMHAYPGLAGILSIFPDLASYYNYSLTSSKNCWYTTLVYELDQTISGARKTKQCKAVVTLYLHHISALWVLNYLLNHALLLCNVSIHYGIFHLSPNITDKSLHISHPYLYHNFFMRNQYFILFIPSIATQITNSDIAKVSIKITCSTQQRVQMCSLATIMAFC